MTAKLISAFMIQLFLAGCLMASKEQPKDIALTISHYKVPCSGESVQLCYLIKKNNGQTEYFHDEIEGFDYQWGYNYTISVEKIIKGKPMADASAFSYKLKKVLKKEKAVAGQTFELPLIVDSQNLVETKDGACSYFGAVSIQTAKYSCADLAKAASAVFRHAVDKPALILVTLK